MSQLHTFCLKQCPVASPDEIIYLQTSPEICFERLKQRGRSEETSFTLHYLQQINERHEEWLVKKSVSIPPSLAKVPVLTIDCNKNLMKDDLYRGKVFEELQSLTNYLLKNEQ